MMKWTEFHSECCDTTFHVKHVQEQNVVDIDHCPSCGADGKFTKEGVTRIEGLRVTKEDVNVDYP